VKHLAVAIPYSIGLVDGLFVGSSGCFLLIVKNHMVRWASCMFFKGKNCGTTGNISFSKNITVEHYIFCD
jgi:hypothetical protein